MNEGIVIKTNANLSYTTDAVSQALFTSVLDEANIKWQVFANRSDVRGGSTLGHLSLSQVSVDSIDIGLAQLAMHSSSEVCGVKDMALMVNGLKAFYNKHLSKDNNHPELAYKTVEFIFRSKGILVGKDVQLAALKRNTPSEFHEFE